MPSRPSLDVPVTQNFSHLDCRPCPHLIPILFGSFKTHDSIALLDLITPYLSVIAGSGLTAVHLPHGHATPRADVFTGITRRFL